MGSISPRSSRPWYSSQVIGGKPESLINKPAHHAGVLCGVGLGHHVLRDDPVLPTEVCESLPVSSILNGILENALELLVSDIQLCPVDYVLEKRVGLLHFVPEVEVVL